MKRLHAFAAVLPLVVSCAPWANGELRGAGPNLGAWTLTPNRCRQDPVAFGPDLYERRFADVPFEDTEVVLLLPIEGRSWKAKEPALLARMPGRGRMVVFRRSDCARFELTDASGHPSDTPDDGDGNPSGRLSVSCRTKDGDSLDGEVRFLCR